MAKVVGGSRNIVNCPECGVTIQYKKSEIRAGELLAGSHDDCEAYVVCPPEDGGCGSRIRLAGKTIPIEVARRQRYDDDRRDFDFI